MSATVEIDEINGAGETITHNIANSNMGSVDSAEITPASNPIEPGNNSFEKWQKVHVTAMGGSSKIYNLKIWRTTALGGAAVHKTNARTTSYGGAQSYVQPVATASTIATQTMPTTEPASANLGIGGSLAGELLATGYSDYLIHQIQTNAADVSGASCTMHYSYDEVA